LIFDPFTRENLKPTQSDLLIRPSLGDVGSIAQNNVQVIGEDGVRQNIDGEDGGKFFDSLSNPLFAVGVIFSREIVDAAQECPANASLTDVQNRNLGRAINFRT
jgi:hypothetical protein